MVVILLDGPKAERCWKQKWGEPVQTAFGIGSRIYGALF